MSTTTRFDDIALRSRHSRVRDVAFGLFIAAMAAFSVTSVRDATLTAQTPAPVASPAVIAAVGSACDVVIC
jgi:hypothetical protein